MKRCLLSAVFSATLLSFGAQLLGIETSEAQQKRPQLNDPRGPRPSFVQKFSTPGGYLQLDYDAQSRALNIRSMSNDGSGIQNYLGIGWSYFTTSVIQDKRSSSSTDPLTTCISANFILLNAQISGVVGADPRFGWSAEAVKSACQSVLPSGQIPGHFANVGQLP